jgi:hypothetical protein
MAMKGPLVGEKYVYEDLFKQSKKKVEKPTPPSPL